MPSRAHHICTITSDAKRARAWREAIEPLHIAHTQFDSAMTALPQLSEAKPDIVLLDIPAEIESSEKGLTRLRHRAPAADLVVDAGENDRSQRVSIPDRWAVTYLTRALEPSEVRAKLESIITERESVARCGWIGITPQVRTISELILASAMSDATVLIEGESGTGKELAAAALHKNSKRSPKPFIALNCSAFPETLLESELFGHEKGAFTDAFARKKGIFEAVDGGTIFLDEIGETTPTVQARLLRVLEERQVRPIGATKSIPVDFRIVAATNRDLHTASYTGRFRHDLFYRLAVVRITLPPLRERCADVPALYAHHLALAGATAATLTDCLDEAALLRLIDYDWPGNIRELRNVTERAQVRFPNATLDRGMIDSLLEVSSPAANLPIPTGRRSDQVEREMIFAALSELKRDLSYLIDRVDRLASGADDQQNGDLSVDGFASKNEVERERISEALRRTQGNRAKAAKLLGVGERTLYRKLKEYGLY